jgi:hypothetical protein
MRIGKALTKRLPMVWRMKILTIKRYEIYFVDLNPTIVSEIRKVRPVVIISQDEMNKCQCAKRKRGAVETIKESKPFCSFGTRATSCPCHP